MKKKSRIWLTIGMSCACAGTLIAAAACGGSAYNKVDYDGEYEWKYEPSMSAEADSDMKIDGNLSEDRWKDLDWLEHSQKGVDVRYTTSFSPRGLYIAAEAKQENMIFTNIRDYLNNASFRFYVINTKITHYSIRDCVSFYVDESTSRCNEQLAYSAKAVKTKDAESGKDVLTAEFFVTWDTLRYDVDEETGMPEYARFVPIFRYVETANSMDNLDITPMFGKVITEYVYDSFCFDGNGYINKDAEGAELGDAANGFAKSDAWDLSQILGDENGENKKISSTHGGEQAIFFKNIYSDRYAYSVKMKINRTAEYPTSARSGVCDMKSAKEFNSLNVDTLVYTKNKRELNLSRYDFYVIAGNITFMDVVQQEESDTIDITVIKDDANYYYIFNGKYVTGVNLPWLGGKTCPGLFSLNTIVEYSDWSVTDYEGAEHDEEFNALLGQYLYKLNAPLNLSGGSLLLDKIAVSSDGADSCTLSVQATNGFVLTDLSVNGKSEYDNLFASITDGKLVFENVNEDMSFNAVFSPMPNASTLRYLSNAHRKNGDRLSEIDYTVHDTNNQINFVGKTTTAGVVDLSLLKAGTYTIGGREITTDGVYTITFFGEFDRDAQRVFTIDTTDEALKDQTFYNDQSGFELNPYRAVKMTKREDGSVVTTTLVYDLAYEFTYFYFNETVTGSFERTMTIDAHIDNWPCAGMSIRDKNGASVEFYASGNPSWRFGTNLTFREHYILSFPSYIDGVSKMKVVYREETDTLIMFLNGREITRVKASAYLTGNEFTFGVCCMRPGADGTTSPLSPENPLVTFKDFNTVQEYTLTLPSGAIVNGEAVTDGTITVPVWSEVTVKVPVDGEDYTLVAGGTLLETEVVDGYAVASLIADCDLTIDCKKSYPVAVSVAGENVEVTVSNQSGIIYRGKTVDGKISLRLTEGEYKALAQNGKSMGMLDFMVTETGENSFTVTLNKPLLTTAVGGHRLPVIDTETGNYAGTGGLFTCGYFNDVNVAKNGAFLLEATLAESSFTQSDNWQIGGFSVGTGTKAGEYIRIGLLHVRGANPYYCAQAYNLSNPNNFTVAELPSEMRKNPFVNGEAKLLLVYAGAQFRLYVNDVLVYEGDETFGVGDTHFGEGALRFGLYFEQEAQVVNWHYSTDRNDLTEYLGASVSFGGGISATLSGNPLASGDKVFIGDEITVTYSVGTGRNGWFSVNGKPIETVIENGTATAVFTVTGDVNISFDSVYSVRGSVTAADGYVNMGDITVTIVRNGAVVDTGTVNDGVFETHLATGEYTVIAKSTTLLGKTTLTVRENGENTVAVQMNRPLAVILPDGIAGLPALNAEGNYTGTYTQRTGGYFAGASVAQDGMFVLEMTATEESFTRTDHGWQIAGFVIGTGTDRYARICLIHVVTVEPYYSVFVLKGDGTEQYGSTVSNVFVNGAVKLSLVYNGGKIYFFANDTFVQEITGLTFDEGNLQFGLYFDQDVAASDWGYSTKREDAEDMIGATLSLASGITATVNGQPYTDGNKVLLGDEIELSMSVAAGQKGTFLLGETSLATEIESDKATAAFTVSQTGSLEIAFASVYAVSGTTAAGATVTVVAQDGTQKKVTADGDGKFSFDLTNGSYTLIARTAEKISAAVSVTVNNGAVANVAVTPSKPLITEQLDAHASYTGTPILELATGAYKGVVNEFKGGYFSGASVAQSGAFLLHATVTEESMKAGSEWPLAQFMLGTSGSDFVRIGIIYARTAEPYTAVITHVPGEAYGVTLTNPYANGKAQLTLAYNNGNVYLFVNGKQVYAGTVTLGAGNVKLGLYCNQEVVFTDWGYTAERTAVEDLIGATLTLEDGITATVNGQPFVSGNKVLLGDEVALSKTLSTGESGKFALGGTAIDETNVADGKATASFVVSGNTTVTFESLYAITVAISTKSGYTSSGDHTVILMNADGSVKDTKTTAENSVTFDLIAGNYKIVVQSENLISSVAEFTVAQGGGNTVEIELDKPLVATATNAKNGMPTFNEEKHYVGYDMGIYGGYFSGATVSADGMIMLEATVTETSMAGGAGGWPIAGFVVGTGADTWIKIGLMHNKAGTYYAHCSGSSVAETTTEITNVFANGVAKLSLVYNKGTIILSVNGITRYTGSNPFGNGNLNFGLHLEQAVELTDWGYTISENLFTISKPNFPTATNAASGKPYINDDGNIQGFATGSYGGYFGGATVSASGTITLEATVTEASMTNAGGGWPIAGFVIGTGADTWFRVALMHNNEGAYYVNFANSNTSGTDANSPLTGSPFVNGEAKMRLTYTNGTVVFSINGTQVYEVASPIASGDLQFGIYLEQTPVFTDWSYTIEL